MRGKCMTVCEAVAMRINELLKEKNITLYRLERESCIWHGTMMRIMHGYNKNITLKTIMQIAAGFKIPLVEFLNSPTFSHESLEIY